MKKKKFTFKTEKPTGRYRSFGSPTHLIKLDGKKVGQISDERDSNPWEIGLTVFKTAEIHDSNPNCDWMWIRLKKKSNSLQEVKDWLNEHIDSLLEKYNIRKFE